MKKFLLFFLLALAPLVTAQTFRGGAKCTGGCSAAKQGVTPPPAIQFTNGNPPNGQTTIVYGVAGGGFPFTATGGLGTISFSLGSGSLPTGLTLSSAGGLTGTPSAIGTYTFKIQAQDTETPPQVVLSPQYTVQVTNGVPPPVITTTSFPNATAGILYGATAQATGAGPFTWSLASGSLPTGLGPINASTGAITGTPTALGVFTFALQVCDVNSACTTSSNFTITVNAQTLKITNGNPPNGQTTVVYNGTGFQFTTSGGFGTITWSNILGTLPNGLTLSSGGLLSGTPTVVNSFTFTVQAQDSESTPQIVTQQYTVQITSGSAPPQIITGAPPAITFGSSYTFDAQGTGGITPYVWSIISGVLPNGITLTNVANKGHFSGTATQVGSFPITLQLCDSVPNCVTAAYTLQSAYPPLVITSPNPPAGTVGANYSFTFTGGGGTGSGFNWVLSGNPPPGLSLNSTTGKFSGIPTLPGAYVTTITLNDSASNTVSQTYTIVINAVVLGLPSVPALAVNNHEFDADEAAPSVTENIKSNGSGNHPWTCAGLQLAYNDWLNDLDVPYVINVDPGTIPPVSGTCLTLTPKLGATHFIIFRSSNPPTRNQTLCAHAMGVNGTRSNGCPNDSPNTWYIQTSAINSNVIDTNGLVDSGGNGPSHVVIKDVQVSPTTSVTTSNAPVRLGTGSESTIAALPSHIHLQYFYIHGDASDTFTPGSAPGNNIISNGIQFNCSYCSIMWGYIDKMLRLGSEGHAIAIPNNTGPYKITNNWLEGSSSGIFHGGQNPGIPNVVSAIDGEERMNMNTYPAAWIGANFGSNSAVRKNAWEMKEGLRILVDGNIFENVDQSGGQGAPCIGIDTRSSSGGAYTNNYPTIISNLTLTNNIFRNCAGFQNDARSGGFTAGITASFGSNNVMFQNNLAYNLNGVVYCVGNGSTVTSCSPYRIPGMISERSHWGLQGITNISTITEVGTTATATMASSVSIGPGASFLISGTSVSGYNAVWVAIAPTSGTTVTFTATNGLGSSTGGSIGDASTCSAVRSGTTGNITLTCTDGGTGFHQTDILVGDPVLVQGCADATFNTALGAIGPSGQAQGPPALTGTVTAGLTVVYNNGSTGAASTTGCVLYNGLGYWNNWQWRHNTVVSQTIGGSTGVYQGACPYLSVSASYMRNMVIQDNIWAVDNWVGFTGNGSGEGSSGTNPMIKCFDLATLTFNHDVIPERTAGNYTAYPGAILGTSASSFLWFPTKPWCTSTNPQAPGQSCIGMPAMLAGVMNQNPSDYHQFELCGGAGNPAGCTGTSIFAAGQADQASDGTDVGANIPAIDAAQIQNTYVCQSCSTVFYPSIGKVIIVSPTGSDSNPGSPLLPVATLDKARQLVAGFPGSEIVFQNGFYQTVVTSFAAGDSGTAALPITYTGSAPPDVNDFAGADQTILSGGIILNTAHGFTWSMGPSTCGGTCQEWDLTIPFSTLGAQQPEAFYYNGVRRIRPCAPYNPSTKNCGYYIQSSPDGTHLVTFSSSQSTFFPLQGNAPTSSFECYACFNRDAGDTISSLHGMTGSCSATGAVGATISCTGVHWVEGLFFERWTGARMRLTPSFSDTINSCTTGASTLCATGLTTGAPPNFGPYAGQRYILDNLAPTDVPGGPQPGMVYFDPCTVFPSCASGVEANIKIQYFANPGETPNTDTPVVPVKNTVITANGVTNVNFQNLTISHDAFVVPPAGQPGISDASNIAAANSFANTIGVNLTNVYFAHMMHWSGEFIGQTALQTKTTNSVKNSVAWDLGSGNLRVGRIEGSTDTNANVAQFVSISNSSATGMQRFMPGGVGLGFWWGNTHDDQGTNLSVSDTYSGAYGVGGSQGYCGTFNTFNMTTHTCTGTNHVFANNIVLTNVNAFNICQGVTSDCGAIHWHSGLGTGNVLNGFDFRDITQDPTSNTFWQGYNGIGVYYDNSSSNIVAKNGQVIRASQASVLFNSAVDQFGQNNTLTNVILAYGKQGTLMKAVDTTVLQFTGSHIISYFDKGNSMFGPQFEGGSAWLDPTKWSLSSNMYFNTAHSLGTGTPMYQTIGMARNYLSTTAWQALNGGTNDSGSTFTTDPGFVAPTCAGGDNYQFKTGPPAGFVPFAVSSFGAQGLPTPPAVPETFKLQLLNCNVDF